MKEWIKQELIKFYKEHTSFDDYRDARELYSRLINALTLRGYDTTVARRIIIEVADEISGFIQRYGMYRIDIALRRADEQ